MDGVVAMGMLLATNVDKAPMLPTIAQVVKNMLHDPADAFFTGRAMDIMFDGVEIDCTSDDKVTTALCLSFDDNKSFQKVDDGHFKFSLFGGVSKYCHLFFFTETNFSNDNFRKIHFKVINLQ